MMLKKNFDSGSDKHQEASKGLSYLLVEGAEIKEIHSFIVVVMSIIMIQKLQENQGASVGVIESTHQESAPMESESVAHDQQPPPPQNHESQESTSQWRS